MNDPITEGRELILRAMAGAVSPMEFARLEELVAAHPVLQSEWEVQQEMDIVLATAAATLPAVSFKTVAFPDGSSTKSNPAWRWLAAAAAIAVCAGVWWQQQTPVINAPTVVVQRPEADSTAPLLVWENRDPTQRYDVWILPEGADQATTPALFKKENVRSPIAMADLRPTDRAGGRTTLEAGGNYELLVCLASTTRMHGTMVSFRLADDAPPAPLTPAAAFVEMQRLLMENQPAAAQRMLERLPSEWRNLPEIKNLEPKKTKPF